MSVLISRQKAIDIIENYPHGEWNVETMNDVISKIKSWPSAEPKKGKWVDHYTNEDGRTVYGGVWCSICGDGHGDEQWCGEEIKEYNYCPNCGAKMIEEEE